MISRRNLLTTGAGAAIASAVGVKPEFETQVFQEYFVWWRMIAREALNEDRSHM